MARRVDDLEPSKINRIPFQCNYGLCRCGCGNYITSNDAHIIYEDNYLLDRSCLVSYLKQSGVLEEIG